MQNANLFETVSAGSIYNYIYICIHVYIYNYIYIIMYIQYIYNYVFYNILRVYPQELRRLELCKEPKGKVSLKARISW